MATNIWYIEQTTHYFNDASITAGYRISGDEAVDVTPFASIAIRDWYEEQISERLELPDVTEIAAAVALLQSDDDGEAQWGTELLQERLQAAGKPPTAELIGELTEFYYKAQERLETEPSLLSLQRPLTDRELKARLDEDGQVALVLAWGVLELAAMDGKASLDASARQQVLQPKSKLKISDYQYYPLGAHDGKILIEASMQVDFE